jgi:hypothetical protein
MAWREFLKVYVPSLIAVVFLAAFLPGGGGWVELSKASAGLKGFVSVVGFLSGFALPLILVSFGLGAVGWVVIYLFKTDRPSYLRFAKNTLFVAGGIVIIGSLSGAMEMNGNGSASEQVISSSDESPSEPHTESNEENENTPDEEGTQLEVVRGEDGEPLTLDDLQAESKTVSTWRETALWRTSDTEELVMWIERGKELNVQERGSEFFEVSYEGEHGYVAKENIQPKDR